MFIIEGSLEVTIGSKTRQLVAGDSYFAPRALPHRLRNTGTGAMRALMIATPGGFAEFLAEAGTPVTGEATPPLTLPTADDLQRIGVLMETHGLGLVPPPAS